MSSSMVQLNPAMAIVSAISPGAYVPVQGTTLFNSQNTSAANSPQTIVITGFTGQRCTLRALYGVLSGAGTATVSIQDGATTILTLPALTLLTLGSLIPGGVLPDTGISASTGNNLNIVVGAGGIGLLLWNAACWHLVEQ